MSRAKAPKGKRRQSSSQRLDVAAMNRNRTSYDGRKLVQERDDGRTREVISDPSAHLFAGDAEPFADLLDVAVQIPRGQRFAVLSVTPTRSAIDAASVVADRHGIRLAIVSMGAPVIAIATGTDLDGFASHLAGHSDLTNRFDLSDIETGKATAGGTAHERECIQAGLTQQPLGRDYSKSRNGPSAALPIGGQRRREDIDRPEWKGRKPIGQERADHRCELDTEPDHMPNIDNGHKRHK